MIEPKEPLELNCSGIAVQAKSLQEAFDILKDQLGVEVHAEYFIRQINVNASVDVPNTFVAQVNLVRMK